MGLLPPLPDNYYTYYLCRCRAPFTSGRRRVPVHPHIPTMPGRSTSGFRRPGRNWWSTVALTCEDCSTYTYRWDGNIMMLRLHQIPLSINTKKLLLFLLIPKRSLCFQTYWYIVLVPYREVHPPPALITLSSSATSLTTSSSNGVTRTHAFLSSASSTPGKMARLAWAAINGPSSWPPSEETTTPLS